MTGERTSGLAAAAAVLVAWGCSGSSGPPAPPADVAAPVGEWWPAELPNDRWYPVSVLALPTGEMVLAETNQNRLFLMSTRDALPVRLPSPGTSPVAWTALAAAPGLAFYALDGPGQKVHQYDLQGNYVGLALDLEAVGATEGLGAIEAAGLAVDRGGQAMITDRHGDRLLIFGPGWGFLGVWGQSGSDLGSWRRPGAVAVGERGTYVVADEGNNRVVLVDGLGNVTGFYDLGDVPVGVAALGQGWVAVSSAGIVDVLDPGLTVARSIPLAGAPGCRGSPHATTALAGDGSMLLAGEGCSGRVLKVSYRGG